VLAKIGQSDEEMLPDEDAAAFIAQLLQGQMVAWLLWSWPRKFEEHLWTWQVSWSWTALPPVATDA